MKIINPYCLYNLSGLRYRFRSKKLFLLFAGLYFSFSTFSQLNKDTIAIKYAETIKTDDISEYLHVLAADSLEGRNTGEKGQRMAAYYIAKHFEKNGLIPVVETNPDSGSFLYATKGKSYFQAFELFKKEWGEVYLKIKGKGRGTKSEEEKALFLKDFYCLVSMNVPEETETELVFAGYGIEDKSYSDYQPVNVKNKAVIIFLGEPIDADGRSYITNDNIKSIWSNGSYGEQKKITIAKQKEVKAVFFVYRSNELFEELLNNDKQWVQSPHYSFEEEPDIHKLPVFYIPPNIAAKMFNTTQKELFKVLSRIDKNGKPLSGYFARLNKGNIANKIVYRAEKKESNFITENILGLVEGTDKKDEIIVLSAHYDHLGIKGGKIYNGADDNGSGICAIIEIAQAFMEAKKAGYGPRRSLLFMPTTGEEIGLLGSHYYTENPVFPMENTIANLNIDMIGRLDEKYQDNPDYVYLIGSDRLSTELHQISEEVNKTYSNLHLDYTYNAKDDPNNFYYRSDHYNFAKNGVPVIFYFNGTHEDYHRHTDTIDKILFKKIEKITKLVFFTLWELANREDRIKVDVISNDE
ncbi:MAG: M28 family peptidase [Cytophagales bacterium]|nr:M28 family peptidase [Cytophagales bacterium]